MTINIKEMTQEELDNLINEIKEKSPSLYQFIQDFLDKKLSSEEVDGFFSMDLESQLLYINSYQARA